MVALISQDINFREISWDLVGRSVILIYVILPA